MPPRSTALPRWRTSGRFRRSLGLLYPRLTRFSRPGGCNECKWVAQGGQRWCYGYRRVGPDRAPTAYMPWGYGTRRPPTRSIRELGRTGLPRSATADSAQSRTTRNLRARFFFGKFLEDFFGGNLLGGVSGRELRAGGGGPKRNTGGRLEIELGSARAAARTQRTSKRPGLAPIGGVKRHAYKLARVLSACTWPIAGRTGRESGRERVGTRVGREHATRARRVETPARPCARAT